MYTFHYFRFSKYFRLSFCEPKLLSLPVSNRGLHFLILGSHLRSENYNFRSWSNEKYIEYAMVHLLRKMTKKKNNAKKNFFWSNRLCLMLKFRNKVLSFFGLRYVNMKLRPKSRKTCKFFQILKKNIVTKLISQRVLRIAVFLIILFVVVSDSRSWLLNFRVVFK